ncbi:MAG: serine/threonine-protein kinase [Polyangiaceae bacterium]
MRRPPAPQSLAEPPSHRGGAEAPASQRAPGDAIARAKALEAARRWVEAADLYSLAGDAVGATRCYYAANDKPRALAMLVRTAKDGPDYREAALLAIHIACELDEVSFDFDQFVGRFLSSSPRDRRELESFYKAANLFAAHDFDENAKDAFGRIIDVDPNFRDAQQRFHAIHRTSRGSSADFERIVEEDEAFRATDRTSHAGVSTAGGADFDLPPLPPLRAKPKADRMSPLPPAPAQRRPRSEPPARNARSSDADLDQYQHRQAPARPSTPAPGPIPIEDVFAVPVDFLVSDRYRIQACVGVGGMAAVYRALDLELNETIALKLFAPTAAASDPTLLQRFKQELALCRRISHPNVIKLFDIGVHAEVRFISMELLSGMDLWEKMDRSRELVRDLGYLIQTCDGLQCVHELGVVHRDLKPENIFITDKDIVKVMDFGIAKRRVPARENLTDGQGNLTMSGYMAGTPAYMAPEQIQDFGSATHLSDLYSLGIIAYGLFTGTLPFYADNGPTILTKQLTEAPVPPSVHEPTIPDELEFIILQLLEKDPRRRIQSCKELSRDLTEIRKRLLDRQARQRRR